MSRTLLSLTRPCLRYVSMVAHSTLYVYCAHEFRISESKMGGGTYGFTTPHPQSLPISAQVCIYNFWHNILSQLPLKILFIECWIKRFHQLHHLCRLVRVKPRSYCRGDRPHGRYYRVF